MWASLWLPCRLSLRPFPVNDVGTALANNAANLAVPWRPFLQQLWAAISVEDDSPSGFTILALWVQVLPSRLKM